MADTGRYRQGHPRGGDPFRCAHTGLQDKYNIFSVKQKPGGESELESSILELATSQGVWAVLFVALLFYVLRTNEKREERYQEVIKSLTCNLDVVQEMSHDVKAIKGCLRDEGFIFKERD